MTAIVAILAVLSVSVAQSVTDGARLSDGAARLSSAFSLARTEAITAGAPVRLRILTNSVSDSQRNHLLWSLWKLNEGGTLSSSTDWERISRWAPLPEGIILGTRDPAATPTAEAWSEYAHAETSILVKDGEFADVVSFDFAPTGRVIHPSGRVLGAFRMRLVRGIFNPDGTSSPKGDSTNWADVDVEPLTGLSRVRRENQPK